MLKKSNIPGQGKVLHCCEEDFVEVPLHDLPPYLGDGLEHVRERVLVCWPPAQLTLHPDHAFQL